MRVGEDLKACKVKPFGGKCSINTSVYVKVKRGSDVQKTRRKKEEEKEGRSPLAGTNSGDSPTYWSEA